MNNLYAQKWHYDDSRLISKKYNFSHLDVSLI